MQANSNRSAILVIDFINDIVHEEGRIPSCAAFVKEQNIITQANHVISIAREQHALLIFIKVGFNKNYNECSENSPMFGKAKENKALILDSWGTEFHPALDYQSNDIVVTKHRVSSFYCTSLEIILNANDIHQIALCGVSTNNAVQATARDAHDRDYKVAIVEPACGAANPVDHSYALHLIGRFANIITINDLVPFLCG